MEFLFRTEKGICEEFRNCRHVGLVLRLRPMLMKNNIECQKSLEAKFFLWEVFHGIEQRIEVRIMFQSLQTDKTVKGHPN